MEIAKIAARGQATIPKGVREAADLHESDAIAFEVEDDRAAVLKATPGRDDYSRGLSEASGKRVSSEDEEARRDL